MTRFKILKGHSAFITTKCCGFTYLPMNEYNKKNCPKCNPEKKEFSDELYLKTQDQLTETVSHEESEINLESWG
jgi:hypothetical protein